MFSSPGHIAFNLGPFSIHWYGILIALGILCAYLYILHELNRRAIDRKHFEDMVFWLILGGVLGARLYYVLFNLSYFSDKPLEILQIWKGGLAIHGGLLGGALVFFIFVKKYKLPWLLYADMILPGVLLAQAIGRWGNFFNHEAFGRPTDLPWKLFIPEIYRPEAYLDFSYFHPTFLYESLWNLLGFLILVFLSRKWNAAKKTNGLIVSGYLLWYSFGRFFIESLRTDSLYFGNLRAAQMMSMMLFLIGLFGLHFLLKRSNLQ